MLNAEQQWRQSITIHSSGHALKERTIFLSSFSFESIQMHIFYETFQDSECSGETLKELKLCKKRPLNWNEI